MTIENLKQIAIKYASTKGSRIPLAPDELCNAVVQYMNSFFGVMADINTIKVAVTEDSGNIVFAITGNTYDGKPITPIVITVDHNDFVTDQEFEEFKTTTNAAIQKNTESINSLSFRVEDTENDITTIQVQVGQINTRVGNTETDVTNLKNRVDNTETNIAEINSTLENKVDVIKNPVSNFVAYVHINQKDENISFTESAIGNTIVYRRASDGGFNVSKGTSGQNVANMQNISDVEAKIPDVSNFATKDDLSEKLDTSGGTISGNLTVAGNNIFTGENEFRNYIYDTSYFCFVDTKEDYLTNGYTTTIKNGSFDISYYENGEGKYWTTYADNQIINKDIDMEGEVVIKFPKKEGTFALTSDIIKNPIYFISFYANEPSEPCHLIGTMMSKNSYGTGQKTNEEFAVMLADNLYVNSNEGLAAYGRLAGKDILCIYSEDGLSIRCLDEENSEVDLPTVMFFVMETEL